MSLRALAPLALALASLAVTAPAHAEAPAVPFVDVELDPLAYALSGHSLHVGLGWDHLRVDLGAFGLDIPEFFHGNEGFSASFAGYGLKVQWFPFEPQSGLFLGASVGAADRLIQNDQTGRAHRETKIASGVQVGWRVDLGAGFFLTPWVGVDYNFGVDDVAIDGSIFEQSAVSFFPTVHLGYRFR